MANVDPVEGTAAGDAECAQRGVPAAPNPSGLRPGNSPTIVTEDPALLVYVRAQYGAA